jgi:hypothetical protein
MGKGQFQAWLNAVERQIAQGDVYVLRQRRRVLELERLTTDSSASRARTIRPVRRFGRELIGTRAGGFSALVGVLRIFD